MATVTINGKELKVWDRQDPGSLGRSKKVANAEREVKEARGGEVWDRIADLILVYVGENEGVDHEWLLNNLPQDCQEIIERCVKATGMQLAGEAKSP